SPALCVGCDWGVNGSRGHGKPYFPCGSDAEVSFMIGQTSVVIPCHNYEGYLAEAIESVYAQTRCVGEIIVVDDGSTRPVQPKSTRDGIAVRIIRTENRGVSAARNLGVSLANGAFIAFLDADDAWAPTKIEMQEEAL